LAHGELSYAKVRALTRVATPETEDRLRAVGRAGTACHVERLVRGWRRVDRASEAQETAQRHKTRTLHVYPDDDGMVVVCGRLTPEAGAVLMQALAAARETVYQRSDGRCITATRAAGSRDVASRSARRITSATGRRADPRRCRISPCFVGLIIARSTRKAFRLSATPTAS
jgi:hypothetical protein